MIGCDSLVVDHCTATVLCYVFNKSVSHVPVGDWSGTYHVAESDTTVLLISFMCGVWDVIARALIAMLCYGLLVKKL